MFTLRPCQETGFKACMDYLYGPSNDPVVFLAPTAYGKSLIISKIAHEWGKPVVVLQPSAELLEQNLGKLRMLGGDAAIYSASLSEKELAEFTYATLGSIKDQVEFLRELGVETILLDECDYGFTPEPGSKPGVRPVVKPSVFMKFVQELKPKKVIGFTATPIYLRTNMAGSQLKVMTRVKPRYFKDFVHVCQIQELTEAGYWAKFHYNTYEFDEAGLALNSSGAEFSDDTVKKVLEAQNTNKAICLRIKKLIEEGKKSILVFMDSIDSCQKITPWLQKFCNAEFLASGITSKKERKRIVDGFKSGEIQVLVNHRILTVGFDYPELENIILGYPTASLRLFYQCLGRGARPHPDPSIQKVCTVDDFCGNVLRFGKVENLVFDFIPGWGWGFFNNDIALTNVPMGGLKITKQRLLGLEQKRKSVGRIWFGIHIDKEISDLPVSYMKFLLENIPFRGPRMEELKSKMLTLLEEDAKLKLC